MLLPPLWRTAAQGISDDSQVLGLHDAILEQWPRNALRKRERCRQILEAGPQTILQFLLSPTAHAPGVVLQRLQALRHHRAEFPNIPWDALSLWVDSAQLRLARSYVPRRLPPQPPREWWMARAREWRGTRRLVTALIGHTGCRGTSAKHLRWEDFVLVQWEGEEAIQINWRTTKTNRRGKRVERTWIRDPVVQELMLPVLRRNAKSKGPVMAPDLWTRWERRIRKMFAHRAWRWGWSWNRHAALSQLAVVKSLEAAKMQAGHCNTSITLSYLELPPRE